MISKREIRKATEAGAKLSQMVTAVRYRGRTDQIEITTSWCTLLVARQWISELRNLSRSQLRTIRVSQFDIHIESADIEIESAGLVAYVARELIEEAERAVGGKFP